MSDCQFFPSYLIGEGVYDDEGNSFFSGDDEGGGDGDIGGSGDEGEYVSGDGLSIVNPKLMLV